MGWKAGIGYELGRGTSRNAANSSACIGNSAQRELQIIYHLWQPPESIIRALFFPSQKSQFTEFIPSAVTCSQEEKVLLSLTTESALQTDHKTSHYLPCPISQSTAPAPSRSLPH